MLSSCSVLWWAVLLCHNVWYVASLKRGKELNNNIIRGLSGKNDVDVWVPRFVFNHKTICAGVTLTAEADLTSATCLDDDDDELLEAFVVVESHGQKEPPVQVAHIDRCVKFDKEEQRVHDLMVCFHHCRWNFSDHVFVPLVYLDWDTVPNKFDGVCSVMGFGHLTADGDMCNVLHMMEIHMGMLQDCDSEHNDVQNYVCGMTTEEQDKCAVDGGEPLLCQHNSSEFFIHGICKQDCSEPHKYKFLLLGYYREWLQRTVPGLVSSSGSAKGPSSLGVEGDQNSEWKAALDKKTDESEKCPILTQPPPVHLHRHLATTEGEQSGRVTSDDGTFSSSVVPDALGSSTTGVPSVSEVQNSGGTERQPITSAEVPPAVLRDPSGDALSVSLDGSPRDPGVSKSSAGGDRPDSDAAFSNTASLASSEGQSATPSVSFVTSSHDTGGDNLREENLPTPILPRESDSGNSDLVNDTSPAENEVRSTTNSVQVSSKDDRLVSGDPTVKVSQEFANPELNMTVLLSSLADGWYLSNATRSAPHLPAENEALDLNQLEKVISDTGALLKFSYVVDNTHSSYPGYRNRANETVSSNKLTKSPNSIPLHPMKPIGPKSLGSVEKLGKVAVGTGKVSGIKSQTIVPSDRQHPVQEKDRGKPQQPLANVSSTDSLHNVQSSSVPLPENLPTEATRASTDAGPANLGPLTLNPLQWDWLKQNGLRIPKNPFQNPKIASKHLLYKIPKRKNNAQSRAQLAKEYWHRGEKQMWPDSDSLGVPSEYREKWTKQVMSYPQSLPSMHSVENLIKSHRADRARPSSDDVSKRSVTSKGGDRKVRETLPGKADGGLERPRHSTDGQYTRRTVGSPSPTTEPNVRRPSPPLSTNRRQPEGTFFGVVSSSVKTRLKRSGIYDAQHQAEDRFTSLADLANWPVRVGLAPSPLTPPVSFLTEIDESSVALNISSKPSFYLFFKVLRSFLPGGNYMRRLDYYKKRLIWGPPAIINEFAPLEPPKPHLEATTEKGEEGPTTTSQSTTSQSNYPEETTTQNYPTGLPDEIGVVPPDRIHRQPREVRNDFMTAPSAGNQYGTDVNNVSAELNVKNESSTAGKQYSTNVNNVSAELNVKNESVTAGNQYGTDVNNVSAELNVKIGTGMAGNQYGTDVNNVSAELNVKNESVTAGNQYGTDVNNVSAELNVKIGTGTAGNQYGTDVNNVSAELNVKNESGTAGKQYSTNVNNVSAELNVKNESVTAGNQYGTDVNNVSAELNVKNESVTTGNQYGTDVSEFSAELNVKNEGHTEGNQYGTDVNDVSAELNVENDSPTAGNHNSSYNGPTGRTDISDRSDSGIYVGTVDKGEDTALPAGDTQEEITLVTADAGKMSTGDTGKQTLHSTLHARRGMEPPGEKKHLTSISSGDSETTKVPIHGEDRPEIYTNIKRLGAGGHTNAAPKTASNFVVTLYLILTWISLPLI